MVCTPSREALLALIRPDMKLTKEFLRRIYSFELSYPGFSEQAISALEAAGCSKARVYYENWVAEYEAAHDKEMKEVARWYRKECEKEFEKMKKEGEEKRKEQELRQYLNKKSDKELLNLLKALS